MSNSSSVTMCLIARELFGGYFSHKYPKLFFPQLENSANSYTNAIWLGACYEKTSRYKTTNSLLDFQRPTMQNRVKKSTGDVTSFPKRTLSVEIDSNFSTNRHRGMLPLCRVAHLAIIFQMLTGSQTAVFDVQFGRS